MMIVKNTKENRTVRDAVANLACSGMYVDEEFIKELLKVANGEKSSEQLLEEVRQRYSKK